ncbi:hypothetical protein [Streptosporangium sp. NPDC000396]
MPAHPAGAENADPAGLQPIPSHTAGPTTYGGAHDAAGPPPRA